jgi:hypothetical protein
LYRILPTCEILGVWEILWKQVRYGLVVKYEDSLPTTADSYLHSSFNTSESNLKANTLFHDEESEEEEFLVYFAPLRQIRITSGYAFDTNFGALQLWHGM